MSKLTKDEAAKLCAHFGDSEKTGEYDDTEVTTESGLTVKIGDARKLLRGDSKAKKK